MLLELAIWAATVEVAEGDSDGLAVESLGLVGKLSRDGMSSSAALIKSFAAVDDVLDSGLNGIDGPG